MGVPVASLALVAIGIWAFLRRKRKKKDSPDGTVQFDGKPELPGEDAEIKTASAKTNQGEAFEISGISKPVELNPEARYELEGGWHGHETRG